MASDPTIFDPMLWKQGMDTVKSGVDLVRSAVSVFKEARGVMTDDAKRAAIDGSLAQAEKAMAQADRQFQIAEAQAAKALGFHLCTCSFPPPIMTSIGYHHHGVERYECPQCKKKHPSDDYFRKMDAVDRHNSGGSGSWMSR